MIKRLIERYNCWCYEPTQDYTLGLRLRVFRQNAKQVFGGFFENGLVESIERWVA